MNIKVNDPIVYPYIEFPSKFNMADYFLDRNVREGRGDNIAIYFKDETFTYNGNTRNTINTFH